MWDDDEVRKIDFPEETTPGAKTETAPAPAKPKPPERRAAKLVLSVVDVISWDDVKIRGGSRGSAVRGIVSLTGWLKKGKQASEVAIEPGREARVAIDESLRALVGAKAFMVALLDSQETGEAFLSLTPVSGDDAPAIASGARIQVGAGEAIVLGGHKREEGDPPERKDQLVVLEVTSR